MVGTCVAGGAWGICGVVVEPGPDGGIGKGADGGAVTGAVMGPGDVFGTSVVVGMPDEGGAVDGGMVVVGSVDGNVTVGANDAKAAAIEDGAFGAAVPDC